VQYNEAAYRHKWPWLRRLRNAQSAEYSEREIALDVLWNSVGDKILPTHYDLKDPLLWGIWQLGSGMIFKVEDRVGTRTVAASYFASKRDALAHYKWLVKGFPRSKEIDYGFPVDNSGDGC
jgi:hypothetical protein